jgi:hypothetical protein
MTRPNGKQYTSRKPPVTEYFEGDWPDEACVMVLRIGDGEREAAREMAEQEMKRNGCHLINAGWFGWWKESVRNHEPTWIYDSERGMPGWVFNVE